MMRYVLIAVVVGVILGRGVGKLAQDHGTAEVAGVDRHSRSKSSERRRVVRKERLVDVQACRDLLLSAEIPDGRHPLLRKLDRERALRRWLELDAPGALSEAERDSSSEFGVDLFKQWVELDPISALKAINHAGPNLVEKVTTEFFVALMARDPVLAAGV